MPYHIFDGVLIHAVAFGHCDKVSTAVVRAVIVPAVTMAVALASIPEVRNTASRKLEELKWKFKSRSKG